MRYPSVCYQARVSLLRQTFCWDYGRPTPKTMTSCRIQFTVAQLGKAFRRVNNGAPYHRPIYGCTIVTPREKYNILLHTGGDA